MDSDQKRIGIAIYADLDHALHVSGGGALVPQLAAAARPEIGFTVLERELQRFLVHVRQHEDFVCLCILHDGRDQSVAVEFEWRQ